MKTFGTILFLSLIFIFINACDNFEEENNIVVTEELRGYDTCYFSGIINNQVFSTEVDLNTITASRIMSSLDFDLTLGDSIVMNYGINIKDSFSLFLDFVIKESVVNLDTTFDSYNYEYKSISNLKNIFLDNYWNYFQDSNYNMFGGKMKNEGKSYAGIYITYIWNGIQYHSALNSQCSKSEFKIEDSYIKPVIINFHQDGSGRTDVDSVLYIEGIFNCDLTSKDNNDTIEIRNAMFKGDILTDVFYGY